jgi:hypothetical protein
MLPSAWTSAKRALVAPTSPIRPTSGTLIGQPPVRAYSRHRSIQISIFAGESYVPPLQSQIR